MKGYTTLGWVCLLVSLPLFTLFAQQTTTNTRASAFLTFSPNHFLQKNETNFFLHGQLNVFTEKQISFYGDAFFDLGSTNKQATYTSQHQLLVGLNYHWRSSMHDLYTGVQPGLGFYNTNQAAQSRTALTPLVSIQVGYRIFISPHFHFFVEGRMVNGQSISKNIQSISNLRFSAGLGIQL